MDTCVHTAASAAAGQVDNGWFEGVVECSRLAEGNEGTAEVRLVRQEDMHVRIAGSRIEVCGIAGRTSTRA